MPAMLPSLPPAVIAPAPAAAGRVTVQEAQQALDLLRKEVPGTVFVSAKLSQVPGLVLLTLAGGKLAYSDKSGRYLILGVIFDMSEGKAIDGALSASPQESTGEPR